MPLTEAEQLAVLRRRKTVAELYLQRRTQWQIAQVVGVDRSTVSRDLAAIRAEWRKSAVMDFSQRRAEEFARIDNLERIALDAWERSCRDAETFHVRTETEGQVDATGRPVPTKTVSEKTTRGQGGDSRFLDRIAWCVEMRLRLIGALKDHGTQQAPVVTIVNGIDLQVVLGQKPGLAHEQISNAVGSTH